MKAEGGGGLSTQSKPCSNGGGAGAVGTTMSALQLLHKIKVKEEVGASAASNFGSISRRAHSPASTTSATTTTISGPAIGAVATVTMSSAQPEQPASCTATVAASCQLAETDLPVDLDLKARPKGSTRESRSSAAPQTNGPPHQSQTQHNTRSRSPTNTPSPSSSPGSLNYHQVRQKSQPQSAPSRSPDCGKSDERSGPPPPVLKTEAGLGDDRNLQGPEDGSSLTTAVSAGTRCSSIIFAADESLKRLLGTTLQFAMKLSPDTGDTVKSLVIGLLSGSVSTEEFHTAVQEVTNYPLRDHVLPCLKQTLPSLQRDLNVAARADNQSCTQYLRANESLVLNAVLAPSSGASGESASELFAEHSTGSSATSHHQHHHQQQQQNHHSHQSHQYPGATTVAFRSSQQQPHAPPPHLSYAPTIGLKRKASDSLYFENGSGAAFDEGPPYGPPKRWASHGLYSSSSNHNHQSHHHPSELYCWYSHPLHHHSSSSSTSGSAPHIPSLVQYGPPQQSAPIPASQHNSQQQQQSGLSLHSNSSCATGAQQNGSSAASSTSLDDEWRNIHVMLNCILGMVDKTKRALAILQKRGCTSPAAAGTNSSTTTTASTGQQASQAVSSPLVNGSASSSAGPQANGPHQQIGEQLLAATDANSLKRLSGEIVAQTIRAEVKRKVEEAVQEVKRTAVAEVQRAVAAALAESRAAERIRNQRYLDNLPLAHHQQQQQHQLQRAPHQASLTVRPSPFLRLAETRASDEPDKETHSSNSLVASSCWNCGRPALETCGGCGVARYCGSFCQHRDWESGGHHTSCVSISGNSSVRLPHQHQQRNARSSSTPSPTRANNTSTSNNNCGSHQQSGPSTVVTCSNESSSSVTTPNTGSECSNNSNNPATSTVPTSGGKSISVSGSK